MIEVKDLRKRFGSLHVLNGVTATWEPGDIIALIGPNGCGKTTLIKSILGLVLPQSGQIWVNGKQVKNEVDYRADIGYMPQIGRYPDNLTIEEVVNLVKQTRPQGTAIDEELIDAFHLKQLYPKKMRTLSGGTTQKVSACLAFLFKPNVLFMDEPTAGLDPLASEILRKKIVREKENNKLVIITSHLLSELEGLVTKIMYMQDGKIVFFDTVAALNQKTGKESIAASVIELLKEIN